MATDLTQYWWALLLIGVSLWFMAKYNILPKVWGMRRGLGTLMTIFISYGILLFLGSKIGFIAPSWNIQDITRVAVIAIIGVVVGKMLHDPKSKFYVRNIK